MICDKQTFTELHHELPPIAQISGRGLQSVEPERFAKMSRREQLEQMLAADPEDVFLQYAVAMAYSSEGNEATCLRRLDTLIENSPDYVAAYFQSGQLLAGAERTDEAQSILQRGIAVAKRVGDQHAESEMLGFLETL